MRCLIESVALLTKLMGIVTPLVLSIVVVVAPRLILYRHKPQDRIIHEFQLDPYRTGLQGWERRERKEAVRCSCVICVSWTRKVLLNFILSYLRTRDPERILPYVDRGTFVF